MAVNILHLHKPPTVFDIDYFLHNVREMWKIYNILSVTPGLASVLSIVTF